MPTHPLCPRPALPPGTHHQLGNPVCLLAGPIHFGPRPVYPAHRGLPSPAPVSMPDMQDSMAKDSSRPLGRWWAGQCHQRRGRARSREQQAPSQGRLTCAVCRPRHLVTIAGPRTKAAEIGLQAPGLTGWSAVKGGDCMAGRCSSLDEGLEWGAQSPQGSTGPWVDEAPLVLPASLGGSMPSRGGGGGGPSPPTSPHPTAGVSDQEEETKGGR